MPSTSLTFASREAHRAWLQSQAALPAGFRVGTTRLQFTPFEAPKPARMTITVMALDRPTPDFAAVFTRNAFPGAPVIIGRKRLAEPALGAVVVNTKIANDCAPDGVADAERIAAATGELLGLPAGAVLPSSTGVIGWRLPVAAMLPALPQAVAALSPASVLPAAEGIMTTDLYPKVRRASVGGGSIVGIAKGAGMVEPNMATMLVYLLTDVTFPRAELRPLLAEVVDRTFNRISVDSDMSTSDSVVAISSGARPQPERAAFSAALEAVCADLAEDVVRNGEGVRHVLRVRVDGAPDEASARALGKAIINSPLVKTAICGNDPNVGRIVMAIGKHVGNHAPGLDLGRLRMRMAGHEIFADGAFRLSPPVEAALVAHLKEAELYASVVPADGVFKPPVDYPPHERAALLEIDLGQGGGRSTVLGGDLTHEYVSENADYRS